MSTVTSLDVPSSDGIADALLAVPDAPGRHPGILLYMDAFGLRPRIAEMAGRFADAGYVVLAPNVFHRSARSPLVDPSGLADPANREAVFGQVMPMINALTPDLAVADAHAWLAFLTALDRVCDGPFATVGYCMGGRLALRTGAAAPDRVAAVASYHAGQVATAAPDSVHLTFPQLRAEIYLAHADNDGSMSPEQQALVAHALDEAGVTYTAELYRGAAHGFTMADTAAYDAAAEQRHWDTALALFRRALR
ncbi:MAG TPA: dienelactone hydrolase family protein [Kineosporiaceae bacterium]|nr:dienelactone hydrolase family protein [Kineosporiaceae bacterium]